MGKPGNSRVASIQEGFCDENTLRSSSVPFCEGGDWHGHVGLGDLMCLLGEEILKPEPVGPKLFKSV